MASGASETLDLQERLDQISDVENQIRDILKLSQGCVSELSKEKQMSRNKMDEQVQLLKTTIANVNQVLSSQMSYLQNVCVGSAHQGSTFGSQQNIALAEAAEFDLHSELTQLSENHFKPSTTPYVHPEYEFGSNKD